MADVHLPGVGGVSRKSLMIGGLAAAGVVALIYLRKRKSASPATAAAADTSGATDTTGSGDYVDPGLQDTGSGPTYGQTGYYDPNSGQWVYGNTGTGQAAATTNQQWAQNAISYLTQNAGADAGSLAAALGAYLTGRTVTSAQESLIDQAIAAEGYPPTSSSSGYPPGIRTQASDGQGGGGTGGGGGGGGGGSGGGKGHVPAMPTGLSASGVTRSGFTLRWHPSAGAASYRVRVTYQGKLAWQGTTAGTSEAVTGLAPNRTYTTHVAASNSAGSSPESNGPTVKTSR